MNSINYSNEEGNPAKTCINCGADFNINVSPLCPACGLHYQEMTCMHCGENFTIPESCRLKRDIPCPHCGLESFRPFFDGVTDYKIATEYMDWPDEVFSYPTEYFPTDLPLGEEELSYPRLVQYYIDKPLKDERRLPSSLKEYVFNRKEISVSYAYLHVRGVRLVCNTTNTPSDSQLRVRIRDRKSCVVLEQVLTPPKSKQASCLFDFGSDFKNMSGDICFSIQWERNGVRLPDDVILWSVEDNLFNVVWQDKEGTSFVPALILFGYNYDLQDAEFRPNTGYPITFYSTTDYPATEYATSEYPVSGYLDNAYSAAPHPAAPHPAALNGEQGGVGRNIFALNTVSVANMDEILTTYPMGASTPANGNASNPDTTTTDESPCPTDAFAEIADNETEEGTPGGEFPFGGDSDSGTGVLAMGGYPELWTQLASPTVLNYSHMRNRRIAGVSSANGNVFDANKVCLITEKGYPRFFEFPANSQNAFATDRTLTNKDQLRKITITTADGSGLPPQTSWFEEIMDDGTLLRYSLETGEVAAIKKKDGQWKTADDWKQNVHIIYENEQDSSVPAPNPGISQDIGDMNYNHPGTIRQIWSQRDGLMDITTQNSMQYTIAWYVARDVGEYDSQTKLYSLLPGAVPLKKYIVRGQPVVYTTGSNGKKYETGTGRELTAYDLQCLRSLTVTEVKEEGEIVTKWEQPEAGTIIFTKGSGEDMETVVTRRIATDPDTYANLSGEYQPLDNTFLRVGAALTREIEEIRTVPGIPGGTRTRYRRYPFGDVCLMSEEGTGTSLARQTTYEYDTNQSSRSYGCCLKEIYSDGKVVEKNYDAKKRLISEKELWAGGTYKIHRYCYDNRPDNLYRRVSATEILEAELHESINGKYTCEKAITRTQYSCKETPALKVEKMIRKAIGWRDMECKVPVDPEVTITEWYGPDSSLNEGGCERAANRIKMTRDASGVEFHYRYQDSSEPGVAYTCTVTQAFQGQGIPMKSTQVIHYYDENDYEVRREDYVHTGQYLSLVDGEKYTRDDAHRIIRTDKANGKYTSTVWMCKGPLQETDENGVSTYYQYNSAKRLISVTKEATPLSADSGIAEVRPPAVIRYFYDAAGRVIEERMTTGQTVTSRFTEWDALDRRVSETDAAGLVTRYLYSADGLETTTIQPTGATLKTRKFKDGNIAQESDNNGQVYRYSYKLTVFYENTNTPGAPFWGTALSTRVWKGSSFYSDLVRETYTSGFGKTLVNRELRGSVMLSTYFQYDAAGREVAQRMKHLPGTRTGYDVLGNVNQQVQVQIEPRKSLVTDTSQNYVRESMCPACLGSQNMPEWANVPLVWLESTESLALEQEPPTRTIKRWDLVSRTLPHVEMVSIIQDGRGQISVNWQENRQGNMLQYSVRDGSQKRTCSLSVDGVTYRHAFLTGDYMQYSYDHNASGLKISVTDARGNTRITQTDKGGRVFFDTDAEGNRTDYQYSATSGLLVRQTNPAGKTQQYLYDGKGRMIAVYGTAAQPLRFEYDSDDRMTAMYTWRAPEGTLDTSPLELSGGDVTRWTYDSVSGVLLKKQTPDGKHTQYYYNEKGLRERVEQRGNSIDIYLKYDLYTEKLKSISYNDETPGIFYSYNDWGLISSIRDASGTSEMYYDENLELRGEKHFGMYQSTLSHEINAQGMYEGYVLSLGENDVLTMQAEYGDDFRIRNTKSQGILNYGYTWKVNSPLLEKMTYPNGLGKEYSYEPKRDFLTGIHYKRSNGTSVHSHSNAYNSLGFVVSRESSLDRTSRHAYTYNGRGEVTGDSLAGGSQYGYTYDNIGNRITSVRNGNISTYTTNNLNQYTSITGEGNIIPEYDADGNQSLVTTDTGNWQVEWNAESRPVTFQSGNKRVECVYDHRGRRIQKTVSVNDRLTSRVCYAYLGYQLVAELDALEDPAHPKLTKSWTWDPARGSDASPLDMVVWDTPETDYPGTEYPETEYPTTAYPTTEYPTTAYPDTEYPDTVFPEGHIFVTADLYWNEPKTGVHVRYLEQGNVTLDMHTLADETKKVIIDRIELAVDGSHSCWTRGVSRYKAEVQLGGTPLEVDAVLHGDTLKIDPTLRNWEGRLLPTSGLIDVKIYTVVESADGKGTLIAPLPCYHDAAGIPLAHVSGMIKKKRNTEPDTTEYPTTAYPTTEYPDTEYPDSLYPEGHIFATADLYWNEPKTGVHVRYLEQGNVSLDLHTLVDETKKVVIDRIDLAVDGSHPCWKRGVSRYKAEVQLGGVSLVTDAALYKDTLKIDPTLRNWEGRLLPISGLIDVKIYTVVESADGKGTLIAPLPCYHDAAGIPLAHVSGMIKKKRNTEPDITEYPTTAYPETEYPSSESSLRAETSEGQGFLQEKTINQMKEMYNSERAEMPRNFSVRSSPGLFSQAGWPDTRYDVELFETWYPEETEYPEITMNAVCTFYEESDTVWRLDTSGEGRFKRSDTLKIELAERHGFRKKVLVNSFQFVVNADVNAGNLTAYVYFDNRWIASKEVYGINSAKGSLEVKLNVTDCYEKERTLVGRKEIMVKFRKNGQPYELTFHCVADGRIASHVAGKVRDITAPPTQGIYHYLTDQNKNITGLVDYNGNITAVWDYDAFGNTILQSGTATGLNPFGFSSEYRDEELGLIYYNYRHYNPKTGRWISKDPANDGANMYRMVGNNAVNAIDVLGLWKKDKQAKNYYCATSDTDNLKDLAKGITSKEEDWKCLWPSFATKDHGYSSGNVKKDDLYTVENLTATTGKGVQIRLDDKLGEYGLIYPYSVWVTPSETAKYIKGKSNEGGTPISYLVIAGHGGVSETMAAEISKDNWDYFSISNLFSINHAPTFERAGQKKGPIRCWFSRKAKAVFSGCSTNSIAKPFAEKILRKGAVSQGTKETIGTKNNGILGDGLMFTKPNVYNNQLAWTNKYEYWKNPVWEFFDGKN